jgi:chemotaxis protein methyltransferase CheR
MIEAAARAPIPSAWFLADEEFRLLRDFVYARSGLCFADGKRFLFETRIQRRLHALGLGTAADYRGLLQSPDEGPKEVLELLDVVTTHETSFFRNQSQIDAFRRGALPAILDAQRRLGLRSVQIWSAGCSSGEEPYTLAMALLEEMGGEAHRWRVRIVGTDVARSMLEKARDAVYSRYSLRTTTPYYVQKYFEPVGRDAFRVKAGPRRLVEFQLVNFADDARMRAMGEFQIIFCRNALIYFDREAKARFVAHFAHALGPGGYLFVGHSESLRGVCEGLALIHFPGATAYQRPEERANRRDPWKRTA